MCEERRVLVVDDQRGVRLMLEAMLADEGYVVECAEHGAAALRMVIAKPPCLILLDLRMPVMDGETFIAEYQQIAAPRAPILILSAEQPNRSLCTCDGVAGMLRKPFDLPELLQLVDWYVSRHGEPREA